MKKIVILMLLAIGFNTQAQSDLSLYEINNYKYIIIPQQFEFLKKPDQYDVNSLALFLFKKYGYNTYLENDDLPTDYKLNNCLGLKANVIKVKGGFLTQQLQINLTDCNNKIIVSSRVGRSKEKEYTTAYNRAFREAFEMFKYFKHDYTPNPKIVGSISNESNTDTDAIVETQEKKIEQLEQEVAALKKDKNETPNEINAVIESSSKNTSVTKKSDKKASNLLYAQPIGNGFQIVDSTPKVVMILLETPKENVFIVKDQNAIVYKEDGFWYIVRNDGETASVETLNIKF